MTPIAPRPSAPAKLEDLLLPTGTGLGITEPTAYRDQYANDPAYVALFGRPHVRMTRQRVSLSGNNGTVMFVEFADADAAHEAAQHAAQTPNEERPLKAGQYERFVVVIEVVQGDLEQLAQEVRALLEKR
jgi:hypothetical protein